MHLEALTNYEGPDLSLEEKLSFLRETRHAFGRTALVLSGGGALGAFHIVSLALFFFCSTAHECWSPGIFMQACRRIA